MRKRGLGSRQRLAVVTMLLVVGAALSLATAAHAQTPAPKLAILQTASPSSGSYEASVAANNGMQATVLSEAQWRSMSLSGFRAYDALVIPERSCADGAFNLLQSTQAAWAPAVEGNELVIGTDPSDHQSQGGAALVKNGMAFAAAGEGTGIYIAFECDGRDSRVVTLMDALHGSNGGFAVRTAGCYNRAHRVANHPAFTDTTDASLSNWSCSVHNAFDRFPDPYRVLAIAEGLGTFTAPDGSIGLPYILAAGDLVTYAGRNLTALGDSVSAGEGIGYGYEWNNNSDRWEDKNGSSDFWDVSFQPIGCHQTDEAHPRVLADLTGASLKEHLSCTGATYDKGLAGVQDTSGVTEPQLGGFNPGPPVNSRYLASKPDLVTLSLGANDIEFSNVVATCFYPIARIALGGCGGNIQDATDRLSNGYLRERYANAYQQFKNVGDGIGKRPVVLHTQYVNPFPSSAQEQECFDVEGGWTSGFSRDEINDMVDGLRDLNALIKSEADKADGVVAVPVSSEFAKHPFCSDDPWVFGMDTAADPRASWTAFDWQTQAPFHPTAAGQREIARQIRATLEAAVSMRRTGRDVDVSYASGEQLRFAEVTKAGTTIVLPRADRDLPSHPNFRLRSGWLIETAAQHAGGITVTLPAQAGDRLWHFVNGAWRSVQATFDGSKLRGTVSSLSPFAVGPEVAPVKAVISGGEGGVVPEDVGFSARNSVGNVATAEWNFGDGTGAGGVDVQHRYRYSGTYTVEMTVRSVDGAVDRTTKSVEITNPGPTVVAEVPAAVRVGDEVVLDSRVSTDPNGNVERGWWELDAKVIEPEGQRNVVRFDQPGDVAVEAVVLDDELKETRRRFTIRVTPPGPGGGYSLPGPGGIIPPLLDREAPHAKLSGRRSQKLGKTVAVSVTCLNEACLAAPNGRVRVPKVRSAKPKMRTLTGASRVVAKGAKVKFKLKLKRATRTAIKRALLRRKRVTVRVQVTVADAARNSRTLTRRVKLKL